VSRKLYASPAVLYPKTEVVRTGPFPKHVFIQCRSFEVRKNLQRDKGAGKEK